MKHRIDYTVVATTPRHRALWTYQGRNAKRDATRHARRYTRDTDAPAKVVRIETAP
jgi:hypothetical protein